MIGCTYKPRLEPGRYGDEVGLGDRRSPWRSVRLWAVWAQGRASVVREGWWAVRRESALLQPAIVSTTAGTLGGPVAQIRRASRDRSGGRPCSGRACFGSIHPQWLPRMRTKLATVAVFTARAPDEFGCEKFAIASADFSTLQTTRDRCRKRPDGFLTGGTFRRNPCYNSAIAGLARTFEAHQRSHGVRG